MLFQMIRIIKGCQFNIQIICSFSAMQRLAMPSLSFGFNVATAARAASQVS